MFLCFRWQSTIAAMEAALKAGLVGKESWDKVREGGDGGGRRDDDEIWAVWNVEFVLNGKETDSGPEVENTLCSVYAHADAPARMHVIVCIVYMTLSYTRCARSWTCLGIPREQKYKNTRIQGIILYFFILFFVLLGEK